MKIDKSLCLLYNYFNYSDGQNREYYDLIRYVLDQKIYYYGNNFKHPHERHVSGYEEIKIKILRKGYDLFVKVNSVFPKKSDKIKIWSSAYFDLPEKINNEKYCISKPPWNYSKKGNDLYNYDLYKKVKKVQDKLDFGNVNELIQQSFFEEIDSLKAYIKQYVLKEDIKAIFLANDLGFFDKLIIQIFKEINRPSFLLIHGLPGIYGSIDNNTTDYLVVWGEAIKQNYIDVGLNPNKIIVNGHPKYDIKIDRHLKFEFDDILVLPKSMPGAPMGDQYALSDRGNCIYYMLSIQNVLKKLGVSKVRFRPHPSEDPNWYLKYLDNGFFIRDMDCLETSLKRSSLIIGPTSTVFLESLLYGKNYVVYEPRLKNENGLDNLPVIPPFNGNNQKVPSAKTDEELFVILKNKHKVDLSILSEYIEPSFNPDLILEKIQ